MEDHGFDVIDCHHHYEAGAGVGDMIGFASRGSDRDSGVDMELQTRLEIMDREHVRGAVIIAGHTYLRPRGLADTMEVNDKVAAYCQRAPDRFLASVGVVEPLYGPAGHDEIRRCAELGMKGISFHNGYQGVPIDGPLMYPLIEKIGAAGMTPFIHAIGTQLETVWQADVLAKDFPDLPMIVLDTFHDHNAIRALPDIAARRPNLYFDLALLVSFDCLGLPLVRAIGAERFVYGTDLYSWPLQTKAYGNLLSNILETDLSDDEKTAILSGNLKRVLKI
jgi:predicted TIM-barrel fold metal-dependent hydrolase